MIIEELYPEREPISTFPGYWRMSGIGRCQKALLAEANGTVSGFSGNYLAAEEGTLHEEDLLRRLADKGYNLRWIRPQQIEVELEGWPLFGHPDGLIDLKPWHLLELKSKGIFMYNRFEKFHTVREAFPVELAQVQSYMASKQCREENINSCLYIAKNRDTGKMYEEIIQFDKEWYYDWFLPEHFAPVIHAHTMKLSVETLSCSTNEHVRRWCPLQKLCGAGETILDSPAGADSSEAVLAIAKWQQAKALADEAGVLDAEARKIVKAFMVKNGLTKAQIDGVPVSIYEAITTSVDKDKIKELIPEEMWSQVFSSKSGERMRIG